MNPDEIAAYLSELDRKADDIIPIVAEAFRERADEHNLDPIAAIYILAKVFVNVSGYADYLMAKTGYTRAERDDLAVRTLLGIGAEWDNKRNTVDKIVEDEQ